jgi:DNA-binding cell septation regulator SpoVG
MQHHSASNTDTIPASLIKPRCTTIRMVKNGGNLRAFASVEFPFGLTIHDLRVIQQAGQKAWVGVPSRQWTDPHGQKRFANVMEMDKTLQDAISRLVLEAYENAVAEEVDNA